MARIIYHYKQSYLKTIKSEMLRCLRFTAGPLLAQLLCFVSGGHTHSSTYASSPYQEDCVFCFHGEMQATQLALRCNCLSGVASAPTVEMN